MKLNRRQMVTGLAAAIFTLGLTAVQRRYFHRRVPPEFLRPDTLMRFLDRAAIVRLGELYRQRTEHERTPGNLLDALMTGIAPTPVGTNPEWRVAIEARSRADFASRRTVELEGWVLSRTEARQCALLASLAA